MFGKPKRKIAADAPATQYERVTAQQKVDEKYPQMRKPGWGKPKKRQTAVGKIKDAADARQESLEDALSPEEIARYTKRKATREGTRK
jgi:hypothetical protein